MKNENKVEFKELVANIVADINKPESIESFKKTLTVIANMQDLLNIELCKNKDYAKELVTDTGASINFGNCIISEANEAQDSTPWKHWKKGQLDKSNLNTEMIDMFHFAPSILLVSAALRDIPVEDIINEADQIHELDGSIINEQSKDLFNIFSTDEVTMFNIINNLTMSLAVYASNSFLLKSLGNENVRIDYSGLDTSALAIITNSLIVYMINNEITSTTLALEQIYTRYLVKNTLNKFRNDNGYNEGTYIKIWDGVKLEDNDVAYGILEDFLKDNMELEYLAPNLALMLEAKYIKVKQNNNVK